jgi:23S rRNA (cytosine1962-C5)-methyltransferase
VSQELSLPKNDSRSSILQRLEAAVHARTHLIDSEHNSSYRLFSGFYEGYPELVVDVYSRTVVIFNYAAEPDTLNPLIREATGYLRDRFPWLRAGVIKPRNARTPAARRGRLLFGDLPDETVIENGVNYAIDLLLDQDASLYLDTRILRSWAKAALSGKKILNTFAYTGSLGVAACAGGASRVLHIDLNRKALIIAKRSYILNRLPVGENDFQAGDFWSQTNRLRLAGTLFDCAIIDAPYLAVSKKGTVDLISGSERLINKVRPLVADGGWLVVVNNALFVSGEQFIAVLDRICSSGYAAMEEIIPVSEDVTGYSDTRVRNPPTDPAPFNHSTKIAILRIARRDKRTA